MEPLDKLVVSVDEALYKAKQQGKTASCAPRALAPQPPTSVGFLFSGKNETGFNFCVMTYTQSR